MVGRKTKLTHKVTEQAAELKSRGYSDKDICAALGISYSTFYRWQESGGATDLQREFTEALTRASVSYKMALLEKIEKAGEKDWRALAFILERRFPSEWARIDRMQAEVNTQSQTAVQCIHFFSYSEETDGKQD